MRLFKILTITALAITTASTINGQTEKFKAAQEAFDGGEYEQTITLLDTLEKSVGTSPRLESLRALAYRDLNKPREAYKALLVYFDLTKNVDLSASEAHKSLIELHDSLAIQFEKEFQDKKTDLQRQRDQDAEKKITAIKASTSTQTTDKALVDPLAE